MQSDDSPSRSDRPAAAGATADPYPSESYAWYVVVVLTIVYLFSFVDRQILSMMVGDIKTGLDLDRDWQVGFLMGPAFAVFYTIFGIPFGRLADSHNRTRIIAFGLAMWSLMTAACGVARNFWHMSLLRIGVGIGEASLSPSAYSIITDYFRKEKLARAIAFYGMGIYFGSGMAYLVGGKAITYVRQTAPWDLPLLGTVTPWQKVFFLVGLPGLLVVPLLLLTVREPARRGLLVTRGAAQGAAAKSRSVPFREVMRYISENRRTILSHNIGFALLSFSSYGNGAWLPEVFKRVHGWDAAKFGLIYGIVVFVCGAGGVLVGGVISDRLSRRGYTDAKVRVGFLAAWIWFPTGLVFPLLDNDVAAMILVIPTVFLASMPFGVAPAAIQQMMPNNLRGQTSAIYLFIVNLLGLAIGPMVLALMTDYVFTQANFGIEGIRYSLLTTTGVAHLASAVLLFYCMGEYRKSLERLRGVSDEA
ncbi:MAG: MFS transporter [Acidobacteria bacterium]|nr:MAG: MFS transporter [Acidobacteriota bacterium]REK07823.1 MAG: MFS transporter [Acidobacteriota bacterium]